ncbi:MAG: hypothetical protein KatS3mg118_1756 [Paracoccaceae bacterium]|nr:MAG: hypothetical protein KatS3mg118_1756 [Paracoccaceae bacterium]
MFDKTLFPFDPAKMAEMFKLPDLGRMMAEMKLPAVPAGQLMEAQKRNMEALMAANRAAAAGYQELFRRQLQIFEETMAEARKAIEAIDATRPAPADAARQAEIARLAYEKALANMTALAEAAQKANREAYEIVADRIRESIEEIRAMAEAGRK